MIGLLVRILKSNFFRLLLRIAGSLATAVIVISGYIAFLNFSAKTNKNNNPEEDDLEDEEPED